MNGFKLFKFLSFCLILSFSSCFFEMERDNSNDPNADNFTQPALAASFIPSAKSGNVPITVYFTNNSAGSIEQYEWDFNDDGIVDSTEQNPSYTFEATGNYNVKLKVISIGHYTDEFIDQIRVSFGIPPRRAISEGSEGPYVVYPADIDNDGDIDLICGYNRVQYSIDDKISWWENINNGSEWTEHVVSEAETSVTFFTISVYAADINNDGHNDVIAAENYENKIIWWENDGTPRDNTGGDGNSWTKREVTADFIRASSVYADDIDGDGDIDIAGASNGIWNSGLGIFENSEICWFKNVDQTPGSGDGNGTSWTKHSVKTSLGLASDVHIADIDNDGDNDIAAGIYGYIDNAAADHKHSEILCFENADGIGGSWTEHIIMPDSGPEYLKGPRDISLADLDGDGDIDIAAAFWQDDTIAIWLNSGGGFGWTRRIIDGDFFGAQSVFVSDIDGDGDMDIAGASKLDDRISWWENLGGEWETWEEHTVDAEFLYASSVFAADINGDGYADLAGAANGSYTTNAGSSLAWWSVFDVD